MASRPRTLSRRFLAVLCLFLALGCSTGDHPQSRRTTAPLAAKLPNLRVIFLSDLEGYLEPCGCQSTSLGGLDRAAAQIAALRKDQLPTGLFAVGNLFFETGGGHLRDDSDARQQEIWKAETLVDILGTLEVQAAVGGPGDLQYGPEVRDSLHARARFPVAAAPSSGAAAYLGDRIMKVGSHTLGLLELTAPQLAEAPSNGAALAKSADERAQALRNQGAELVVALAVLPRRTARRVATHSQALDFLVLGGKDQDGAGPPEDLGHCTLLTSDRHGRGLLVLDLQLTAPGQAFADDSAWSREAEEAARAAQAADLAERIASWEQDPQVDKPLLEKQKARLKALQQPLAPSPAANAAPNRFQARLVPLPTGGPQAPGVTAQMAAYDAKVNSHNREALADRVPPPAPAGQPHYVGAQVCSACHQPAFQWWQGHPHGKAYDTLSERNKEYNLSCVGCHVTGYGQPGGSTVTHNAGLIHVGCESCHGAGSTHAANPSTGNITRSPQANTCQTCHNQEHSDQFEFQVYRQRLLVPGHGLPPEPPAP